MKISEIIKSIVENSNSAFFYTPPIYDEAVSYIFGKPSITIDTNDYEDLTDQLIRIDELKHQIRYDCINTFN